jgi:hypothetical protein
LSHEELAVARVLAAEGHDVRSMREGRGRGPVADLSVCGKQVEVKSWLPSDERDGRAPTPRSVFNKLMSASRQADVVVLNGRGSGLTDGTVRRGIVLYSSREAARGVSTVRVLGDGFDLTWSRVPGLAREVARDGQQLQSGQRRRLPDPRRSFEVGQSPESRRTPELGRSSRQLGLGL